MKVLVAEDDQDQLSIRSMLLRQNGFDPLEAADYPSAVRVARSQKPECALIDLRLPTEELGFRLVRELKRLNSAIHVVLLTGGNFGQLSQRSEKDLVDDIVVKGSSSADLIKKLKSVAGGR
jgi:two-component system phosphate regulon response regulator PhoB